MNKLPTAREFYDNHPSDDCVVMMIDFAKLHVQLCKEEICKNVKGKPMFDFSKCKTELVEDDVVIDEESILNSYPLDLIK